MGSSSPFLIRPPLGILCVVGGTRDAPSASVCYSIAKLNEGWRTARRRVSPLPLPLNGKCHCLLLALFTLPLPFYPILEEELPWRQDSIHTVQ